MRVSILPLVFDAPDYQYNITKCDELITIHQVM